MQRGAKRLVHDMPDNWTKVQICAAEFLGTGSIVFFGCMGCTPLVAITGTDASLAFGFIVMAVIVIFAHISNAHFNPAVTICGMIFGNIPVLMGPLYIISQYLGSVAFFGILKFLIPPKWMRPEDSITGERQMGVCTTFLRNGTDVLKGVLIEFMLTGALVWLCCGVWDQRNATRTDSVAIKFGLIVALLAMIGGPYTCASINPARSFGPAVWNNDWKDHWVYIVGPCAAGVVFTLIYLVLFGKAAKPTQVKEVETPLQRAP